ncbi:MAG: Ig domain-containing protein, partial [Alistipes sp.]|nr:Ig domain-containing protein [Alistipes sp.]
MSLDKTEVALIVGESANVKAIVKPDDAANKEVKWTVANTSIATVDEGEVTAVAVGETTLKVTTVDGGHTATIPVKVTAKTVKVSQIKLVGMPTEFKVGRSVTISAVITPDDATDKSVTFTSSNPEVATVEYIQSENNYSLALLKAVGPGKATITATANDGSGVKAEAEVTVIDYHITLKTQKSTGTELKLAIRWAETQAVSQD